MDIEKLAQDPALSPYIDAEKLAQFRSDYEVSLTKDIATNSAELSDTYDKMIDYLGPLAGKLASRQAAMDVSPQQAQATAPQAQPPILQVQETPAVPAVAGTAAANTTPTAKKGTLELGEKVIADFEKSVAGLKATSVLLEDFKRASDTKADVAFDVRYVTYSERDYDKFKARLKGLEELATLLSEGGSAPDLKAFVSDARDLADSLNDSLIFLKAQASAEITAAREKYDGNESSYNYVKKALDSFGKGYYNRASIYARAAISPQASAITGAAAPASADFPIGIFAAFSVAAAAAAYALRKPKQPQVKRLLRLPED
jgi:hypothetical protein